MLRPLTAALCMLLTTMAAHAQPADQKSAPKATTAKEEIVPKATQHMVKAPVVNIEALRDPFASYLARMAERNKEMMASRRANMAAHPHEELEDFDLSTLQLVAIMRMGNKHVAMVQDTAGKGYMVQPGNYMGKNNGRIEKITNDSVILVEQILNPAGALVDHKVTLTLKEVNQ